MENLSDNQKAYAKNYLANQAESVEEALNPEIHLRETSSELNQVMEKTKMGSKCLIPAEAADW